MDYFGLVQNLPAHDALNDAYFTALVAQKLDVPKGVKEYDAQRGENLIIKGEANAASPFALDSKNYCVTRNVRASPSFISNEKARE